MINKAKQLNSLKTYLKKITFELNYNLFKNLL
jgi:hypothetical protein